MLHPTKNRRLLRRFAFTLAAATASVGAVACAGDKGAPAAPPQFPGLTGPAAAVKPVAFIADVNVHDKTIRITSPSTNTLDKTSLSMLGGAQRPNLSLLGGDAVRLLASNYQASAVGAFIPGKVRVTFDVTIENKLPGINFVTPTWPTPPSQGVMLIPLEQVVTTTPGSATGGDGNDIIVEQPSYGAVVASIDWNGTGAAGSGAPFNFFNDADCGLGTSNDCFRWRAFTSPVLASPATSESHTIGFDIDPTVGQFRARMIVAADLVPASAPAPSTISGTVTSPVRGPIAGATVSVTGGITATTDATGAYSLTNVAPGTRTVSVSALPAGCTTPATQNIAVAPGSTNTANFTVDCAGVAGTINGTVTRSNDGSALSGVTVSASGGGSATTNASGAFSITGVAAGAGTLNVTGAPAECTPAATAYTLGSGATITQNIVVTCDAAPQPGYQYTATWSTLSATQVALDLRIDMRTFDDPTIANVTTAGANGGTGDPLLGAQLFVLYDSTKLTFNSRVVLGPPQITTAPTINGNVHGRVTILAGTIDQADVSTGNVAIVRLVFDVVPGATGTVTTTSTFQHVFSGPANLSTQIEVLANTRIHEGTLTLP